jgi:hypothetical protein
MTDEVFDLDAAAAEAEGAPLEFTFCGERWSIKHMKAFGRHTKRALSAIGGNDDDAAVDLMLSTGMGAERYERWKQLDPGIGVEEALLDRWLEHCGLSRGKSESSTDSSVTTETPSTPASSLPTSWDSATSSPDGSALPASSS